MSDTKPFDIAVIGGGVVGTATAMALLNRFKVSLVLLEKEDKLAAHQTGNNSGVIHSGLYYKPGSLKARNCVAGREAMYRFCAEHGVRHEKCGKVVVAVSEAERPRLENLELRGRANNLEGIRRLTPEEIHELEPGITGMAGLWVPQTGIVDYKEVTQTYATIIRNNGGEIRMQAPVLGVRRDGATLVLETPAGEIRASNLINCGGLQSDRIARLCGVEPGVRIIPFRGEYYTISPAKQSLIRNLVYPVPDPQFPFLGVHFTRMVHGGVEAGPNAVLAFKREGYTKTSFSLRDTMSTFTYPGALRLFSKHWKMGLGEFYRSFNKHAFLKALQRLCPDLELDDLKPGGAGVRAQAIAPDGGLVDDFKIVDAERMIHVLNAPSPAATASISIGQAIAQMAEKRFELK